MNYIYLTSCFSGNYNSECIKLNSSILIRIFKVLELKFKSDIESSFCHTYLNDIYSTCKFNIVSNPQYRYNST